MAVRHLGGRKGAARGRHQTGEQRGGGCLAGAGSPRQHCGGVAVAVAMEAPEAGEVGDGDEWFWEVISESGEWEGVAGLGWAYGGPRPLAGWVLNIVPAQVISKEW
jgi:hypothetical protein